MIIDSGNRREFETGAVRDIAEGKGRCDLLPLDIVAIMLKAPCLSLLEEFKKTKDLGCLYDSIERFIMHHTADYVDMPTAILEVSKHYEEGATKYGENNWKKGIPIHCYIDSGARHCIKHLRGDTDERHDRAFIWNILCAAWTFIHKPELDDIEKDISQK